MKDFFKTRIAEIVQVREAKTCQVGSSLTTVLELMRTCRIGSVIIMDGVNVAGIITERDFLNEVVGRGLDHESEIVDDFMTPNPVCISVNSDLQTAFRYMRSGGFRHLVVTQAGKQLHSVLSATDLVRQVNDNIGLISLDKAS